MRYALLNILLVIASLTSFAQESVIFAPEGLALKGYDPVAIFKESKTVKGSDSLSYTWMKASWHFSSRENLEAFMNDPEKYAPQYGGYCAYGVSEGHKAPTEIDTWTIVDDKLYFNYNHNVKKKWDQDRERHIKSADEQWKTVKHQK